MEIGPRTSFLEAIGIGFYPTFAGSLAALVGYLWKLALTPKRRTQFFEGIMIAKGRLIICARVMKPGDFKALEILKSSINTVHKTVHKNS